MKFDNLTNGQTKAVIAKLGGADVAVAILRGKTRLITMAILELFGSEMEVEIPIRDAEVLKDLLQEKAYYRNLEFRTGELQVSADGQPQVFVQLYSHDDGDGGYFDREKLGPYPVDRKLFDELFAIGRLRKREANRENYVLES